jgi:hypothetical protein
VSSPRIQQPNRTRRLTRVKIRSLARRNKPKVASIRLPTSLSFSLCLSYAYGSTDNATPSWCSPNSCSYPFGFPFDLLFLLCPLLPSPFLPTSALLNVPTDASPSTINASFRSLALVLHPDKQRSEESRLAAQKAFARVGRAYQVLTNPKLRAIYDTLGEEGLKDGVGLEVGKKGKSAEEVSRDPGEQQERGEP